MRIGIVVPGEIMDEIIHFLSKEFPEIEAVPFPYRTIVDIPDILSGHQGNIDTFLFLGNTARRYAEKAIPHSSEWLTIPRSVSALLRLLFRAEVAGHSMKIATDMDNTTLFDLAFREIGLPPEEGHVEIMPVKAYSEGLLIRDAARMEKLYRSGAVSFCITIFYQVRDMLKKRGVPVYILQPSYEDIRNGLQRLVLTYELQLNQNNRLAVIAIHTDTPKNPIPEATDFRLSLEKLAVAREVYRFAKSMDAACIEQPPAEYMLFATSSIIENMTDHYRHLHILQNVAENTAFTLSIGIGYGSTAADAKYHALRAMNHAIAAGGNQAYLIGRDLFTPVPMAANDKANNCRKEGPIDEKFLYLSKKSGVSIRILSNLYHACRDEGRLRFTSAELADLIGVTTRTMNRIIAKLIDHHLAQDVGRQFTEKTGRPSRIIEILLEPKMKGTGKN